MIVINNNLVNSGKFSTYVALLTLPVDGEPVLRVLNQDDKKYLGDIHFSVVEGNIVSEETFEPSLTLLSDIATLNEAGNIVIPVSDEGYNNITIEVAVRERGAAPVLLSAETNTTGDKVILTFNKKMSGYLKTFDQAFVVMVIAEGSEYFDNGDYEVVDNIISVPMDTGITSGQVILCRLNVENMAESLDYGLLQRFENFPVTNNVVE